MSNPNQPNPPGLPWEQEGGGQPGYPTNPTYPSATPDQGGAPAYNPYGQPPTPNPYGQYGQPGGSGAPPVQSGYPQLGYPQAGDPSMPLYPYGQPGAPSQPMYPYGQYGQPTAPSQPMYPYGAPTQYGPPSQGFPPQTIAPQPKKSRRGLVIGLVTGIVLLALIGGGVVVGLNQYKAPANAATQFCSALQTQNYTTAYSLLSSSLKAQYSADKFTLGSKVLDQIEGNVTNCAPATGNAYNYTLFASTASISSVITRAQAGQLTGTLHLVNENGWKISAIDTSLLGVNLNSLDAAGGFCAALQQKDYATAYSFLGTALQSQIKQSDFVSQSTLHDQIDGAVTACGITAFGQGNSDSTTNMTVSITRSTLGNKTGPATLDLEGGAWKFSMLDTALQGSDLGGLAVINQFCAYLHAGAADKAYDLTSSDFRSATSRSYFDSIFGHAGVKYSCSLKLSTIQIDSSSTSVQGTITLIGPDVINGKASIATTFLATKNGSSWQIEALE